MSNQNDQSPKLGETAPALPHLFDFLVTADLQMGKDGEAKQLVEASAGLSNFPFPALGYVEKNGASYRLVPAFWNPVL